MKNFIFSSVLASFALAQPAFAEGRADYFPDGIWGVPPVVAEKEQKRDDQFYEEWFGDQLAAMKEEPLWIAREETDADTEIRLLFLPTFENGTMVKVFFPADGQPNYVFKRLDGAGGYEPGSLVEEVAGELDERSAAELLDVLARIDPFGANIERNPDPTCLDGTQTVLEVSGGGKYTAIQRHECQLPDDDPIRKLVDLLDKASGGKLIAVDTF